jgi:hypothetical protein
MFFLGKLFRTGCDYIITLHPDQTQDSRVQLKANQMLLSQMLAWSELPAVTD